ncbi:MAG TPA: PASTA domain-containing protein, partial [Chitinophagales bacterium]|nr:PASTA domain-containing protein [Chitinophagales bacterium]
LKVQIYRPFPGDEILSYLNKASKIIVIDRAPGLGAQPPLFSDIKSYLPAGYNKQIVSTIIGLGGNIKLKKINKIVKTIKAINKDSAIANKPIPFAIGTKDEIKEINNRFRIKFDFKPEWEYAFMKSDTTGKFFVGSMPVEDKTVPNVKGMLADDAVALLENKGLVVSFYGKGKVSMQTIPAGSTIVKGSIIQLILN